MISPAVVESNPLDCTDSALIVLDQPVEGRHPASDRPVRTAEVPLPTVRNSASTTTTAVSATAVPAPNVKVSRAVAEIDPFVPVRTMIIGVAVPAPVFVTSKISRYMVPTTGATGNVTFDPVR